MSKRRLAIAFLLCGAILLALGVASWAMGLDLPLHGLLRLDPAGPLVATAILISVAGEFGVVAPVVLAVAALLAVRRRGGDAAWLLITVAGGRLLVEIVKHLVHRQRPPLAERLEHVGGLSFPSAHSAGMAMAALAIAFVAGGGPAAIGTALAVAAAIGWSRVALAVHWPGDVLAGWGIGMAWVAAAVLARGGAGDAKSA